MNLPPIPKDTTRSRFFTQTRKALPSMPVSISKINQIKKRSPSRELRLRIQAIRKISKPYKLLIAANKCGYDPEVLAYIPEQVDHIWRDAQRKSGVRGFLYKRALRKDIFFVLNQIYQSCRLPDFYRAIASRAYLTPKEKMVILHGSTPSQSFLRSILPRQFIDPFHL